MGNLFTSSNLSVSSYSEISADEYERTRKTHWPFYDNYLYQSAVNYPNQEKSMKIVRVQCDMK